MLFDYMAMLAARKAICMIKEEATDEKKWKWEDGFSEWTGGA
jgi:hypothetical protein